MIESSESEWRTLGYKLIISGKIKFPRKEIQAIVSCLNKKKGNANFDNTAEYMKITEALRVISK